MKTLGRHVPNTYCATDLQALVNCRFDMAFATVLQSCAADIIEHQLQASLVCPTQLCILLIFLEV